MLPKRNKRGRPRTLSPEIAQARVRYREHDWRARGRGIPFLLTFEEWWDIWQASGKWEQRGSKRGCYTMSRHGDKGPYSKGNVKIVTVEEKNAIYDYKNPAHSAKISAKRKGQKLRPQSDEHRRKLSEATKRVWANRRAAPSC